MASSRVVVGMTIDPSRVVCASCLSSHAFDAVVGKPCPGCGVRSWRLRNVGDARREMAVVRALEQAEMRKLFRRAGVSV